jgi:hypothetical protein
MFRTSLECEACSWVLLEMILKDRMENIFRKTYEYEASMYRGISAMVSMGILFASQ